MCRNVQNVPQKCAVFSLILLHQRADRLKITVTETNQTDHIDHSLVYLNETVSHACWATQDRPVMVESSDKMWFTGEGNSKPLQYSCLENPMNSMKRQKDRTLEDELPRLLGANMLLEISGKVTRTPQILSQ